MLERRQENILLQFGVQNKYSLATSLKLDQIVLIINTPKFV